MTIWPEQFIYHKNMQMTELTPAHVRLLSDVAAVETWEKPESIRLVYTSKSMVRCDEAGGHYFMGGLPALMQAARLLQQDPTAKVTYVNDGQLKKSTQSAHQGHVHPTEWTTPELGTWPLVKVLLSSFHLYPATPPDDVLNYSYVHFQPSNMKLSLFIRNACYRILHTLLSKKGVSRNDRWQCEAVRASLAFHKELSDEIERAGGEPTFAYGWRLIWSPDKEGIDRKKRLWEELGIHTEYISKEELRLHTLLKEEAPLYGLKVFGDGKFFANVDHKIVAHLVKKHQNTFHTRIAAVSELYVDNTTNEPFAVCELASDGSSHTVAIDTFFGSPGHNQVFKGDATKPLWDEVPVTGVSTLWACSIEKSALLERFGVEEMTDDAVVGRLKQFVGTANLTNLHMTIWNASVENGMVHIIIRATEGANFNSELADPNDLYNMAANIKRFFIGSWQLITAGSCVRKTTTSNVPELKDHFIHGLSGIGLSFSAAPKEIFIY